MGHGKAFTAVCAEGRYMEFPHDPIGCFRSVATFYVVPTATDIETMIYMGLHEIWHSNGKMYGSLSLCELRCCDRRSTEMAISADSYL
eukprot:6002878-Pleurochrysis_carterae.AAC.1